MSSIVHDIETQISKMGYSDEKAERIYYAHVKPLENALAKAVADKAALFEALDWCIYELEPYLGCAHGLTQQTIDEFEKCRAALARVKEPTP